MIRKKFERCPADVIKAIDDLSKEAVKIFKICPGALT